MPELQIEKISEDSPQSNLYCQYDRQSNPQGVYVWLDLETGRFALGLARVGQSPNFSSNGKSPGTLGATSQRCV